MSAVRMVAYGVLELKNVPQPDWLAELEDTDKANYKQKMFEHDQLIKLVNDELRSYGLLLAPKVQRVPRSSIYVLYGERYNTAAFSLRKFITEGSFQKCCIEAAKLLDAEHPVAADGDNQQ